MGATARPSRPSHDPGPLLVHARPRGSALLDAAGAVGDAKNLCILDRPHTEWVMLHGDALSEAAVRAVRSSHASGPRPRSWGPRAWPRGRRDQPQRNVAAARRHFERGARLLCAGRVPRGHRRVRGRAHAGSERQGPRLQPRGRPRKARGHRGRAQVVPPLHDDEPDATERERGDAYVRRLEGAKKELEDKQAAAAAAAGTSHPPPPPPPPPAEGATPRTDRRLTIFTASVTVAAARLRRGDGHQGWDDRPPSPFITGRNGTYTDLATAQANAHQEAVIADIGFGVARGGRRRVPPSFTSRGPRVRPRPWVQLPSPRLLSRAEAPSSCKDRSDDGRAHGAGAPSRRRRSRRPGRASSRRAAGARSPSAAPCPPSSALAATTAAECPGNEVCDTATRTSASPPCSLTGCKGGQQCDPTSSLCAGVRRGRRSRSTSRASTTERDARRGRRRDGSRTRAAPPAETGPPRRLGRAGASGCTCSGASDCDSGICADSAQSPPRRSSGGRHALLHEARAARRPTATRAPCASRPAATTRRQLLREPELAAALDALGTGVGGGDAAPRAATAVRALLGHDVRRHVLLDGGGRQRVRLGDRLPVRRVPGRGDVRPELRRLVRPRGHAARTAATAAATATARASLRRDQLRRRAATPAATRRTAAAGESCAYVTLSAEHTTVVAACFRGAGNSARGELVPAGQRLPEPVLRSRTSKRVHRRVLRGHRLHEVRLALPPEGRSPVTGERRASLLECLGAAGSLSSATASRAMHGPLPRRLPLLRRLRRESTRSPSPSTAAPSATACSRSRTTSRRCATAARPAWMKLFDDRWMRTQWPFGSGVWGKREWVAPDVPDDCIVSTGEGGTNVFWADRLGREIGLADLWIKLCGNSHTGSFKDLGMTVLVSVVRQAIKRGRALGARALLREHRRHQRVARGLRGRRGPARRGAPAARDGVVGAARAAARARRARLRARDGLRRLHGRREGARAPRPRLPRQLDEPAAHRGAEDGRDGDRAAVRLGVARLDHPAERQPGQRRGALRRASRRCASSASSRACRASASPRQRAPTRCTAPSPAARTSSSPSTPSRRSRAPSRSATR